MYIYKVTNKVNGKIYIGLSTKKNNPSYFGSGKLINKAIKKYGLSNFEKEILEECTNSNELAKAEIKWIEFHDSCNPSIGYNISPGGDLNPNKQRKPIHKYDLDGKLICKFDTIEDAVNDINDRNLYRNSVINTRPVKGYWFSKELKTEDEIQKMHVDYLTAKRLRFMIAAAKRWENKEYRDKMTTNIKTVRTLVTNYTKTEETKAKISNSLKNKRWYNNGVSESLQIECPPNWNKGRLKK
jgi:hypothetical protein